MELPKETAIKEMNMSTESMSAELPFQARLAQHAPAESSGQYSAIREDIGVIDFSLALPRVEIRGEGALDLVNSLITRDLATLKLQRCAHSAARDESGKMRDDCNVSYVGEGYLRYSGFSLEAIAMLAEEVKTMGLDVRVITKETAHLAVQGPLSRRILASLANKDISNAGFPYDTCRDDIELGGILVFMARVGYTVGLGYELSADKTRALDQWDSIATASASAGLTAADDAMTPVSIEGGLIYSDID